MDFVQHDMVSGLPGGGSRPHYHLVGGNYVQSCQCIYGHDVISRGEPGSDVIPSMWQSSMHQELCDNYSFQ